MLQGLISCTVQTVLFGADLGICITQACFYYLYLKKIYIIQRWCICETNITGNLLILFSPLVVLWFFHLGIYKGNKQATRAPLSRLLLLHLSALLSRDALVHHPVLPGPGSFSHVWPQDEPATSRHVTRVAKYCTSLL